MSIARALSNAVSGLTATARGTETVAANLANVMTPGYARREVALSAQTLGGNAGGVRIDGIVQVVNASLVSEARLARAASSEAAVHMAFLSGMEDVIGLPGEGAALSTALSAFETALHAAAARPDDDIRLTAVLDAAQRLAGGLNAASAAVQSARIAADQAIAADVAALNRGLEQVAELNRRISIIEADGADPSSLVDERRAIIDRIGMIVPLREIPRQAGTVALFTAEGAVLLDGTRPTLFGFEGAGPLTPEQAVGNGSVGRLVQNGTELTASQMRLFAGGSLSGNFAIRDDLAPRLQQELDELAFDLHERLADPAVDASLTAVSAGLFTDAGQRADIAGLVGLAGRLSVNAAVDEGAGGDLWRLRSGLEAAGPGAVGDPTLLNALAQALDAPRPPLWGGSPDGNASLSGLFASLEARVSTRRIGAESEAAARMVHTATMSSRLMADGVDSDAEMHRLLQYEQAYAANARVIQAINEMMDQILRL